MSRRANCWDNAPQESFFGHMKDNIDVSNCETNDDVKAVVDDWIDYYNNERYQWDLAKLAPREYYEYVTTGLYPLPFQPSAASAATALPAPIKQNDKNLKACEERCCLRTALKQHHI